MATLELTGARRATVFLYHEIGAAVDCARALDRRYCIPTRMLSAQLALIGAQRRPVLTLDEIHTGSGPDGGVGLTFDDGSQSHFEQAVPALLEAGAHATFFLNPAHMEMPGYMNWSQARELVTLGMRIESHGWFHNDLTRVPSHELGRQLRRSRLEIEARVGSPVHYLAAPFGSLNRRVRQIAIDAGYRAVCSSANCPARAGADEIPRLPIYASTRLDEFDRLLRHDRESLRSRRFRTLLMAPARYLYRWMLAPNPTSTCRLENAK